MAAGGIAGGQAQDLPVPVLAAQHGDDPVHRTHELDPAGTPAHAPGDRQLLDTALDDVIQAGAGSGALYCAAQAKPVALGRIDALQLVRFDTLLSGKTDGGGGPVAGLVPGAVHRWSQCLHRLVWRLQLHLGDQHGQAPRRGEPLHLTKTELALLQAANDAIAKGQAQGFQSFGWQLFRAQLHQQGICTHAWLASAWRFPSTSRRRVSLASGKPSFARASK